MPESVSPLKGLRIEPLWLRVQRNRIRFAVFLTTFVIGSAVLLTGAFVAVPGSLIGLVVDTDDYYAKFGLVVAAAFGAVLALGGIAAGVQVLNAEHWVTSRFTGKELDTGEVVAEEIEVDGERLRITGVTIGNPHCVVHSEEVSERLARRLGPALEAHPLFPAHTNVQFVKVLDRRRIAIEIWERGAGYTLASGSSSCAAVAASVRLGLCSPGDVTVLMPGGSLEIGIDGDYAMTMLGPVGKVADGVIAAEVLRAIGDDRRAKSPAEG